MSSVYRFNKLVAEFECDVEIDSDGFTTNITVWLPDGKVFNENGCQCICEGQYTDYGVRESIKKRIAEIMQEGIMDA